MKNYIGESTRYTSSILERISCNQKEIRRKWRVTKKKEKTKDRKCQKKLKVFARDTMMLQGSTITLYPIEPK